MSADDWRPTASLTALRDRARLLAATRGFFAAEGYWEVETPLLSRDTCVDAWIEPVAVPHPARPEEPRYLQTSPEFAHKRLLAAGADAILEITRSFRQGEAGSRHNLEFTIAEWYRVGDTHREQMALVERLIRAVAAACPHVPAPELPRGDFPRYSYDAAAREALGTTVLDKPTAELIALAGAEGLAAPVSLTVDDRDGWLNLLLAERIEPWLARQPACFLYDYPATQAALARVRRGPPDVAERFELYLGGLELCNGYHEETDPEVLAARFRRHNEVRAAHGQPRLPIESRLLAAMRSGLPQCAGVALGIDRLAMWRLGQRSIADVLAFPEPRA